MIANNSNVKKAARGAVAVVLAAGAVVGIKQTGLLGGDSNTDLVTAAESPSNTKVWVGDLVVTDRLDGSVEQTNQLEISHRIEGVTASASSSSSASSGSTDATSVRASSVAASQVAVASQVESTTTTVVEQTTTTVGCESPDTTTSTVGETGTSSTVTTAVTETMVGTGCSDTTSPSTTSTTVVCEVGTSTTSSTSEPATTAAPTTSTGEDPSTTASTTTEPTATTGDSSTTDLTTTSTTEVAPGSDNCSTTTTSPEGQTSSTSEADGAGGSTGGGTRTGSGGGSSGGSTSGGSTSGGGSAGSTSVAEETVTERVTSLAAAGTTIGLGDTLYSVDGQAVIVLFGQWPAWRSLDTDSDDGIDVLQLETSLAALGYDDDEGMEIDETYDSHTAAAVSAWQTGLGLEATGEVALGDVVFITSEARIQSVSASVGEDVTEGDAIVTLDATSSQIVASVPEELQSILHVGFEVTITVDGEKVPGVVDRLESNSSSGSVEVRAIIVPTQTIAAEIGTVLTITVTSPIAEDATIIPAESLISLLDGSYEIVVLSQTGSDAGDGASGDGAPTQRVSVTPVAESDGDVAIAETLPAGSLVRVP